MATMATPPPPFPDAFGGSVIDYVSSSPPPPPATAVSHSSSLKNLSPSILIIFTVLALTAFASVILCLVLRYLNRRCLQRLSAVPGSSSSSSSSSSVSRRHIIPVEQSAVRCTNSFSPIDSLPLFSFSSITRRSSTAVADCAVCLSKFEAEDQLRLLPLCCHAFHAQCVDTWLQSNQSCPLCRSTIFASESDVMKASMASYAAEGRAGDSFRLEIGSISRRQVPSDSGEGRRSYSIGSFEYFVEEDSEVNFTHTHRRSVSDKEDIEAPAPAVSTEQSLAAEVGSGRNWLKDYVDRLSNSVSSRALSFRGSGRFFTGSSRRSEVTVIGDWEQENSRVGEEISELFRWFSGV